MTIDLRKRETFKKDYIEKHGENGWIKLTGHYLEFPENYTLEQVVFHLIKLRNRGLLSYYTSFNGTDLFVRDVTLESAFLSIHNMTKKELKEYLEKEKRTLEEISNDKNHILKKEIH